MRVRAVLGALSLGMPFVPSLAGQPQAVATQQRLAPVAVPQGDGAPVLTDGAFTPGEWDDALVIPVAGKDVALHVKEYRGVVFVGVRGTRGIGPSELSLAGPGGPIRKLHVSYALYEVELPPEGPEPKPRMGLTSGWYANELRRARVRDPALEGPGGGVAPAALGLGFRRRQAGHGHLPARRRGACERRLAGAEAEVARLGRRAARPRRPSRSRRTRIRRGPRLGR
jgi:hypothetical protein